MARSPGPDNDRLGAQIPRDQAPRVQGVEQRRDRLEHRERPPRRERAGGEQPGESDARPRLGDHIEPVSRLPAAQNTRGGWLAALREEAHVALEAVAIAPFGGKRWRDQGDLDRHVALEVLRAEDTTGPKRQVDAAEDAIAGDGERVRR